MPIQLAPDQGNPFRAKLKKQHSMLFHLDWGRGWDFASVRRSWGWCHNSPCLTIAWEGGLHCLDFKAESRESKLVLRNGQFIWTACRLGYFMDGRLLSNWDTIEPLLCWENGQRRKDESQETVGRIRILLAKATRADQGLALAASLTSEFTMAYYDCVASITCDLCQCMGVLGCLMPLA